MGNIRFDLSGRGGLAPRHWGNVRGTIVDPASTILAGEGQMANGVYNPLRRLGYLSPSNGTRDAMTYSTGSLAALPASSIIDTINNTLYMAEHGINLWRTTSSSSTVLENAVALPTGAVIQDLEIYEVNGIRNLFVLYKYSGNLEIAIGVLPYSSATDNITWLSATVTGTAGAEAITGEAFMELADNGFAYLFRNNRVDKIDGTVSSGGTNGTITNNVLLFPNYFAVVDAQDYRGNMYIALHQDARDFRNTSDNTSKVMKCGVYIWDRLSNVINTRDYITIEGVKSIQKLYVTNNGRLRAITISAIEGIAEIREFNGSTFDVIQEIAPWAFPRFRDGLTSCQFGDIWMGEDANLYMYGRPHPSMTRDALYKLYTYNYSYGGIYGGAIALFGNATPALYYGVLGSDPSAVYRYKFMAENSDSSLQGDIFTPVEYLPERSTIHDLDIYMYPSTGSGTATAATIKIYFNQSSTAWASKNITYDEAATGYKKIPINHSNVHAVQLEIEYPNVAADADNFFPSTAVIDYSEVPSRRR